MSALKAVAELMAIAARTAPKTRGDEFVVTHIIEGAALQTLAQGMFDALGKEKGGKRIRAKASCVMQGTLRTPKWYS